MKALLVLAIAGGAAYLFRNKLKSMAGKLFLKSKV